MIIHVFIYLRMLFDHFLSFFFPHTGIVTIIGTPSQTRFAGCPLYTPGPTSQCLPREFKVLIAGYLDSHPLFPLWNLLIPLNVFYFKKNLGGKKGLSLVKGPIMWGSVRVFIMVKKNTKKLRGSPRARWKWQMNDFNGTLLLTRFASWWFHPAIVQFISVLLCDRWFSFHDLL